MMFAVPVARGGVGATKPLGQRDAEPPSLRGSTLVDAAGDFMQVDSVSSWCQYVPDPFKSFACRGGGATSSDHPTQPPRSQDGTQNGTVPSWCKFVPTTFQSVACHGSGRGCRCADWCSSTSTESRRWNPECCGCSEDMQPPSGAEVCVDQAAQCGAWAKAGQCSANPEYMHQHCKLACGLCEAPTPAAWGDSSRDQNSTQNGTVPAWCQFIPTNFQSVACHGSGRGCQCADRCSGSSTESQRWNPECCGCLHRNP